MWRWPPRCRLAEECRHHTPHSHTHTHTHPPTQHKAPVGRREFSAPFLSSQPIIPLRRLPSLLLLPSTHRVIVSILPRAAKAFSSLSRETTGETMGGERGGWTWNVWALMMAVVVVKFRRLLLLSVSSLLFPPSSQIPTQTVSPQNSAMTNRQPSPSPS